MAGFRLVTVASSASGAASRGWVVAAAVAVALFLSACGSSSSTAAPGVDVTAPVVSSLNVISGSVLRSGFVAGLANDGTGSGVALVEVALDGGAFAAATGTTNWRFQLPTGTNTWREGSPHTVTVRATDADSNVSAAVGPVTFHKGPNEDINGDGYADLVINGVDPISTTLHQVFVFLSDGTTGLPAAVAAGAADTVITGEVSPQNFGARLAMGDVNGDGYADLIVGAQGTGSKLYLFLSTGSAGLPATLSATAANSIFDAPGFTSSLASADVNGDGYTDLAYGDYNSSKAYVYLSAGATPWPATVATTDANSVLSGENSTDNFGNALALGDVNGDTFADVLIGAPNYSTGVPQVGRAYLFLSSVTGLASTVAAASADSIFTGSATLNFFGRAVGLADLNGDGYSDAMVSGTDDSGTTGSLYVYYADGTGGALAATLAQSAPDTHFTGSGATSEYGIVIASADSNGDGFADLLIGDRSYSSNTGRFYLFLSTGTGFSSTVDPSTASSVVTGEATSNFFGISLALADLNGDGLNDVIAGAPFYNGGSSSKGRAYVFFSDGTQPLPATLNASSADSIFTGGLTGFGTTFAP